VLLAIDTATALIGVSLDDGDQVLVERIWRSPRHHTVQLGPEVALTLQSAGASVEDLSVIAVASGPGSYTGLRIGMALAKGLALSNDLPLVAVPTLSAVARAQPASEKPLLAVLEVGRGRVAAVWYKWGRQAWQAESEPVVLAWSDLIEQLKEPTIVAGELGAARARLAKHKWAEPVGPEACLRRPSYLGAVARQLLDEGVDTDPALAVPSYLGEIAPAQA
jgi:tRNA threonylcarbamoyladenosine biosynthesis protein TsaB